MSVRLPAIFFGHGNPMNALLTNQYTAAWRSIGENVPAPKAVLSISAHWFIPSTSVTVATAPRTIHDFGGFPAELYSVQYPAAGEPELARRVQELLAPLSVHADSQWGLDHGTWSVLHHVYPEANIPVVQLSIDKTEPPQFHFSVGEKLAPLRDENILIMGSGNIVHNLHAYSWGRRLAEPYEWAMRFETAAKQMLLAERDKELIRYEALGRDAMLSIPTPEHYFPLLYVLGTRQDREPVTFPVEGVDGGSVSMLTVQIG